MKELGLDLLGLPAARLHNEVNLAIQISTWLRGEALRIRAVQQFGGKTRISSLMLSMKLVPLVDSGSPRAFMGKSLRSAVVALPPQGGADKESLWHEELKRLCRDIALLKLSCTNCRVPPGCRRLQRTALTVRWGQRP